MIRADKCNTANVRDRKIRMDGENSIKTCQLAIHRITPAIHPPPMLYLITRVTSYLRTIALFLSIGLSKASLVGIRLFVTVNVLFLFMPLMLLLPLLLPDDDVVNNG